MSMYCLILAAGDGKRMKSKKPKVLLEVLSKPMLSWVCDACKKAGAENIAAVVGNGKEQVTEFLGTVGDIATFEQTERKGTGHAVMMAKEFIEKARSDKGDVLICCGDAPFIDEEVILSSYKFHKDNDNEVTVVSARVDDPFGYGRIIRDTAGGFLKITEQKDCTEEEKAVQEINSGIYWFKPDSLLLALSGLKNNNAAGEYYLTDTIEMCSKKGAYKASNSNVVLGANNRVQLASLNKIARDMIIERLQLSGVDIPISDGVMISPEAVIGADTTILPGTIIKGNTVIGEGCVIGPNSLLINCVIEDNVVLNNVQATDSKIDKGAKAGPFVHLRPGTHLHEGVKIGDFVEVKNSEIGKNTCIAHLTYIGDSDVGKGVNFGCGCVTANYDGVSKFRTTIGDNAFIGCNTNLIAPVNVGDNATTGAGSTITKDVPPNSLVVERSRTIVKENWEKNSRRIKKA